MRQVPHQRRPGQGPGDRGSGFAASTGVGSVHQRRPGERDMQATTVALQIERLSSLGNPLMTPHDPLATSSGAETPERAMHGRGPLCTELRWRRGRGASPSPGAEAVAKGLRIGILLSPSPPRDPTASPAGNRKGQRIRDDPPRAGKPVFSFVCFPAGIAPDADPSSF